MNDLKDLFNEFTIKNGKGKRFDYSNYPNVKFLDHFLYVAKSTISLIRGNNPHFPEPYIDFVENYEVNAFAWKSSEHYFIAINIGTIFSHRELFCRLLASKNTFKGIGDPTKETLGDKIYNLQVEGNDFLSVLCRPYGGLPQDTTRQLVVQLLEDLLFMSIIAHEYAHIIFGHVDFLNSIIEEKVVQETSGNSTQRKLSYLDFQTLEMDADSFGTKTVLNALKRNYENLPRIPVQMQNFFGDWNTMIQYWMIANYSSYRLHFTAAKDVLNFRNVKHPLPSVRQFINMGIIVTLSQSLFKKELSGINVAQVCVDVAKQVEFAFKEVTEYDCNPDSFDFCVTPEGQNFISALHWNWNVVRPLLQPFTIGRLAPEYSS